MATENDKTIEARRKALRNGEEDPIVVAQRFLNIYRQMHIFSAERKEAFDKMLLELPPDIRGIFLSLPGGVMLQDYVDELAEKHGVEKSVHKAPEVQLNDEANQQAQILASALAKAQSQSTPQPIASAAGGPAKLSMDKDFAGEFAKIMSGVLQQQTNLQKASMEKLALDLSKTQLFIAKSMKEGKEEQRQELSELCKTIADSSHAIREEQRQELNELCKVIADGSQAGREEQRQEISALCKAIAASHTTLAGAIDKVSSIPTTTSMSASAPSQTYDDSATKELIAVVLDGQKQINQRLDKVEETSLSRANDNTRLIEAFEKSQAEMIKSLSALQYGNLPVKTESDNEEKLIRIISESQEKLVKTLFSANVQQNNNNTAQSNNNANNIQINTSDNSAQLMLLVEKISSLQAANEQNLTKAITQAVEEQSRLYDNASRQQTKELAAIIADGLKEGFKNLSQPIYVPQPSNQPLYQQQLVEESNYITQPTLKEPEHIPYSQEDTMFDEVEFDAPETVIEESIDAASEMAVEEVKQEVNTILEISFDEEISQDTTDISNISVPEPVAFEDIVTEEKATSKKKKKKKKKKKNQSEVNLSSPDDMAKDFNSSPLENEDAINNFNLDDLPVTTSNNEEIILPATEDFSLSDVTASLPDNQPLQAENKEAETSSVAWGLEDKEEQVEPLPVAAANSWNSFFDDEPDIATGSDWGFSSAEETLTEPENTFNDAQVNNDNQEGEDWEWAYVEDYNSDTCEDYQYMEAIGSNSYICSGDLYGQDKADNTPMFYGSSSVDIVQSPQIFDETDEEIVDPYQNSILKD